VSRVGIVIMIAFAGCTHAGAGGSRLVPSPPTAVAAPMPDSLVVAFTDSTDSLPARLVASGHYQLTTGVDGTARLQPLGPVASPLLIVKRISVREARDALDVGVDVLVTADPSALAYAATRADLVSVPRGWERTYVFLARSAPPPNEAPGADSLRAILRAELAANAVRAEARASEVTFREADEDTCAGPTPPTAPIMPAGTPRIVYERGDDVARALATRLVALASEGDAQGPGALATIAPSLAAAGGPRRADGLSTTTFARTLTEGSAAAFVFALAAHAVDTCGDRADLAHVAPWARAEHVVPVALVDTRARIVARRGVNGVPFAWLGAP
jgi:hypothetical protein